MKKKILILSEAFGSGHTKAAEALAEGILHEEPSIHIQIVEIGKILHPTTTSLILRSYQKLITKYPNVWKKLYQSKQDRPIPCWLQFIIYQLFHRNIEQVLEQIKPHLVICTHPFSSSTVSRLKKTKKNGYPVRLCTVITDFHAHRVWVQREVDLYIVSGDEVSRQLMHMGIPRNRIAAAGIPVKSDFSEKTSKQEARTKLKLQNLPTVLVMGGGLGLGGLHELAHSLLKWKDSVQLLICAGYNDALRLSLQHNELFQHPHIRVMGFVDIIDQLLDAADLLITKPGGLTCFEALSKGVPMLIYQPIPGHEEYNCRYLVECQLAIRTNDVLEVDGWIGKLLYSPESFASLHENMKQFQQSMNSYAGVESVLKLLNYSDVVEPFPIESVVEAT
ncbi:glycosyltransferase [Paenibacillus sp. LC231]|uniref:MGDG synthase family glycosyltransferase n=1 Tax=Paenibacillus sp. LC231 TaxID=1120679 RepID=UPI0009F6C6D4|nr:glycosyltransferase [Paenibacillus sp. LC231]